jgi:hypothetical protein
MAVSQLDPNSNEQQRVATTLQRWLSTQLADHFWNHHPFWVKLKSRQNILSGGLGEQIVVPIKHAVSTNPVPRGVVDSRVSAPRNFLSGVTRAKFDTCQKVFNFSIDNRELRLQGSETKKIDWIASQLEIARDVWDSTLIQDLWADEGAVGAAGDTVTIASLRCLMNKGGTSTTWTAGPPPHPAQLCVTSQTVGSQTVEATAAEHGLLAAMDYITTPSAITPITTIGGINRNAAGAAQFCVPTWYGTSALAATKASVNKVWLASGIMGESADLAITDREFYSVLMGLIQDQQRFEPSQLQKFGFQAFQYNGVDFIYDDYVPFGAESDETSLQADTSQLFFLNTKNLALYTDAAEPTVTFQKAVDAPVTDYQWEWYGQLIPKALGRGLGSRACAIVRT